MPTHRGITIALQSQYEGLNVPEYTSREPAQPRDKVIKSIYIPTYPASQFWVCYQCPPPPIARGPGKETRYYYFKLYSGDKCVLSWGVGEAKNWSGKTVFGLYDGGRDFEGSRVLVKRAMMFPALSRMGSGDGGFRVEVFRSFGRRRERVKYEVFEGEKAGGELGIK